MNFNGLTLLVGIAVAAGVASIYNRSAVARRHRVGRIRDRAGAAIVAGYVHGLEDWLAERAAPPVPAPVALDRKSVV